ncbi:hypothetical protein ASR50_34660 [Streptomyces sp. 4F]|nr:hypothetical protein ASR50_00780 [Streptomyces sp. 4F]ALV54043.1 hypothetical protein ASR50_34660 [Streptomyces sp. 4F]
MRVSKDGFIERQITFGYDFRMRCGICGRSSKLSGADYIRLETENHARMECDHCDDSIHFGPLAADLRDQDDPALDDGLLTKLNWYHTSTYVDWPSIDRERDVRATLSTSRARELLGDPEPYLQAQLDKALHLGTYEAAIENMYRRMRDQDDADSAFYLHRVHISVASARVAPGYRDETNEAAANISLPELAKLGLDAVRYLNVWEAWGSISLAVRSDVITDIQTIPVPSALGPVGGLPSRLIDVIEDLEHRNETPTAPEEREFRSYDLAQELDDALVAYFLPGVNPVVAYDFVRAVGKAHGRIDSDYRGRARLFAAHASLLHSPERVLGLLDAAPSRRHDPA